MSIYVLHGEKESAVPLFEEAGWDHGSNPPVEGIGYDMILQWGREELSGEENSFFVLNGAKAINNLSSGRWRSLLPLHGLAVGEKGGNYSRKLLVASFQQEILGIYSNLGPAWLAEGINRRRLREFRYDEGSRWVKRVTVTAIRSLYAMGLDFGSVLLGQDGNKWRILSISPRLPSLPTLFQRLRENVVKLREELLLPRGKGEIFLGADPEFILQDASGRFLLASRFFPQRGDVGCDRIWLRGDRTKRRLPIAELRPIPSPDPKELAKSIVKLLRKAARKVSDPRIRFLAGATPLKGYPIGGHIHFSPLPVNHFLVRALDNYLALPLFLLEDPEGFVRRPRYGFLGDVRTKPHGGFEYRTLPSWLISPRIAKGVLILSKLIALHYDRLRQTPLTLPSVQEAFYGGKQEELQEMVLSLWEDLERIPAYSEYEGELERFKEKLRMLRKWNQKEDFRSRWRLPPTNGKHCDIIRGIISEKGDREEKWNKSHR
ncbi:conserved hypothetical protein [[Clostridium] ultunense Esp]|nr:conserved hypothetical protein [[Clostridium] ultunense Esp]